MTIWSDKIRAHPALDAEPLQRETDLRRSSSHLRRSCLPRWRLRAEENGATRAAIDPLNLLF